MTNLKPARFSVAQRPEPVEKGIATLDHKATAALEMFGTESGRGDTAKREADKRQPLAALSQRRVLSVAKWIGVIALSAGATAGGIWAYAQRPGPIAAGSFTLNTTPSGLQVAVAGKPAGLTPLTLTLPAGDHRVVVSGGGQQRELAVTLKAGETVVQNLEMAPALAAVLPTTGSLRVQTDPLRQAVMVDGIDRGFSPVTVASLAAGQHLVVIRGQRGAVRRTVTVEAGTTVSLVVSPGESAAGTSAGWLTVTSPILLQLKEQGKLIGSTETERLMLPPGDHEIEMVNDALGYRTVRRVTVAAGKTTAARVQVPTGMLSINAVPWAEVWIGGERIGETPIGNLSRPIGVHEVILRHPEFGQQTASVTVSLKQTARLGVDMRKP